MDDGNGELTAIVAAGRPKERAPPAKPADPTEPVPLCVDLDGTLVRSDTLVDSLFMGVGKWRFWRAFLTLITKGRAAMKRKIAEAAPIHAPSLPYNEALLEHLRNEKARGRTLVLATAADQTTAEAVNAHLRLFDVVLGSDGTHNLKGARKAEALVALFGEKGFAYAGGDGSDLGVWLHARSAVIVNASRGLKARAAAMAPIEAEVNEARSWWRAIAQALRPHQWVKNLLVLVPVATAHALGDLAAWISAAWTFAAFCAVASSIYVINDLTDLKADRLHARKRKRPFASGALSGPFGLVLAGLMLAGGAILAAQSGVVVLVALYAVLSLSYSLWFKELPLIDIFLLAALYTLRLFAGGEATGHPVSLWLLGFSSFFFLSLALVKRVSEMMALPGAGAARRGYTAKDLPMLQLMGIASGFTAVVVLALFVQDETASSLYASPVLLWSTVPLILFWICRIWLSAARGFIQDDPIVYAAKDWVSWLVTTGVFGTLAAARILTFGA